MVHVTYNPGKGGGKNVTYVASQGFTCSLQPGVNRLKKNHYEVLLKQSKEFKRAVKDKVIILANLKNVTSPKKKAGRPKGAPKKTAAKSSKK